MKTSTLSIVLLVAALNMSAQVIHVSPGASGDGSGTNWANASTLEKAVSNATNTSVLWVQAGTYMLSATLEIPNGVRLYGGFIGSETQLSQRNYAANPTIFDANHNFAAVTLGVLSVLNGFTIQNGVANISTRMSGGGVWMSDGSKIEHCYILNNVAATTGGGVFVEAGANVEIFSTVIAHNRAGVDGVAVYGDNIRFRSSTVVDNTMLNCDAYPNQTFYDTICQGQYLTLRANVSGTYLWSTGATTVSITTSALVASTTFSVTITMPNFCILEQTFEITVNPKPSVTIYMDRTSANPGDMVTFIATGTPSGGRFLWDDIAATTSDTLRAQMPAVGDLQFTINYLLNSCAADPVTVTSTNTNLVPPVIDGAILTVDDPVICLGDSTLLRLHERTRNSGEWVLFSGSCGGTEIARTTINNPTFWVRPTATTTYFLRGEAGSVSTACISVTVTVNPLPMPISASQTTVCVGENLVLSNPTVGGGTWDVGLTGRIALVSSTDNSATITGLSAGEAIVGFTTAYGCQAFFDLEVLAASAAIVGDTNFCQGTSRVLTAMPIGGTWSTAGGTSATINPTTGNVTASTTVTGATTIQYSHPTTGCRVSRVVVVHQQPAKPSTSAREVCVGDSITLNPGTPAGGTWSITPVTFAELNSTHTQIIGRVVGNAVVRYSLNEHCSDTFHVIVLSPVTGLSHVNELCQSGTSTASGVPTGGTWTSTVPTVATINPTTGNFTGVSTGNFSLVYTLANGCSRMSLPITIHPTPDPIAGNNTVGVGLTTQLTGSPSGGTWSSLNTTVATVDATGLVTGINSGTTTIRYILPTGNCHRDHVMRADACATLTLSAGASTNQTVCLNSPILNIQYVLTNATTTQIAWTNHEGVSIPQPTGIAFNTTTHTISGIPTMSGLFNYTITSTDHAQVCSPATASGTLTVFDAISAGIIGSTQGTTLNICYGVAPVKFTSTTAASGGKIDGSSYQWQISTDNITFSNIAGAISLDFQAGALTTTSFFRRVFQNDCGDGEYSSNVITVTVHNLPPTPTAESIVPNTDCSGNNPNGEITITQIAGVNYSLDGTTFGTNRRFTSLVHGQHTIFIRDTNNCVSSANVNVVSESGAPELDGTMTVTPGSTICNPFAGGNIVITPTFNNLGASPIFQWSIVGGADIPGAINLNLTLPAAPTTTTTYRITATNTQTGCHAYFDQTITVMPQAVITTQPVRGTICVGQTAITLSVTAISDGHFYQWQNSSDSVIFTNISWATANFYSVPNTPASALWYRVQVLKPGDVCPTVSSDAVQVNILPLPTIATVSGTERCSTGAVAISATANPSTATIRWFSAQTGGSPLTTGSPNTGITASGVNWTTPSITATTTFWAEADNGFCVSTSRTSVVATVLPAHVITRSGGDANQNVCQGAAISPINFAFSGGATGGTIVWSGVSTSAPTGISATATSISGTVATTAAAGTYNFTITSTPAGGICSPVTYSGSITVNATPAAVTISTTPACGSTVLTASGGGGGTIYWQNTTSGGTSTTTASASQAVTANGTYFFRARSTQGCWGTQGSTTVTITQPHILTLTNAAATANQSVGINSSITNIVYTLGGSATEVTLTWTGTTNPNTPPAGINVSSLTATPITISGRPTEIGIYTYTITTVANLCAPISQTGTITVGMRGCNLNTPGWGAAGLGTITWGDMSNTIIESGATTILGSGSRSAQVWSGAVFASVCNKGNATDNVAFDGGGGSNFNADCRQTLGSVNGVHVTGHLFSWCAVMRFADQLCPYPWRVPTERDFINLDMNMDGTGNNRAADPTGIYFPTSGTTAAPQIGGMWGGARLTGSVGYLPFFPMTIESLDAYYWSSTETSGTTARHLHFNSSSINPQGGISKDFGFVLRCVRDTVLPILPNGCNQNTPNWGGRGLGTITWGNTSNTNIESGLTIIQGTDSRSDQVWSGTVFAEACAKGNANNNNEFDGGNASLLRFNADCRQTLASFNNRNTSETGDFFSWCAVARFADQLCPYPWRVPTTEDFAILHENLGHTLPPQGNFVAAIANTYMPGSGGSASAPIHGGTWGGTRFAGWIESLASASTNYWSSSEDGTSFAYRLSLNEVNVWPQSRVMKTFGLAVRCVRDTVLPILPNNCNQNIPGWGSTGLGTVTWGNVANMDIESETTTIRGTGGRPAQTWSGAVFATACNKGTIASSNAFDGGTEGNYNADCRRTLFSVNNRSSSQTGDLFSWCAVARFADEFCPYPWRVPTIEDFAILHLNLGYTTLPDLGGQVNIVANTYIGTAGTTDTPQIGGTWRGPRFTGHARSLTTETSNYWSSTESAGTIALGLSVFASSVFPQNVLNKTNGNTLRCVRDTVLPHVITRSGGAASQTVCQGSAITTINFAFSGGATGGTIAWSGASTSAPTGLTATATSISGTVSATATAGTYNFTIISTQEGGDYDPIEYSGSITVNVTPTAVAVSATPACGSTVLAASGGSGGTIYWQNTTSNGTSTTTASASQTVTANGTYYFRARSTQGCWGTQGSRTVTITAQHTLTRSSGANTQSVAQNTAITNIVYARGGGATGATIAWTGTTSTTTAPTGITVSSLTGTTITISGTPTVVGTYGFTITTTPATPCTPATQSGTITVTGITTTGCNNNALTFTLGTPYFVTSQTWTIPGTGGRATQIWSDAVRAPGCAKTTFNYTNWQAPFVADCRSATNGFDGHYFSWCLVVRFAAQLCPAPWRVPTRQDFINLDMNLGGNGLNRDGTTVNGHTIATQIAWYIGTSGSNAAAVNRGGIWGGTRLTSTGTSLTGIYTLYWTSTEDYTTSAHALYLHDSNVSPQYGGNKADGFAVRCVR